MIFSDIFLSSLMKRSSRSVHANRNESAYSCSNFSSLKILRFIFLMNKILIQERACSKRITFGLEVFTE